MASFLCGFFVAEVGDYIRGDDEEVASHAGDRGDGKIIKEPKRADEDRNQS